MDQMYEVERRFKGKYIDRIPAEAKLVKKYESIEDNYLLFNPNNKDSPLVRIRLAELVYPMKKQLSKLTAKTVIGTHYFETEIELPYKIGKLIVETIPIKIKVVGFRDMYSYKGLNLCFDYVKGLGIS